MAARGGAVAKVKVNDVDPLGVHDNEVFGRAGQHTHPFPPRAQLAVSQLNAQAKLPQSPALKHLASPLLH